MASRTSIIEDIESSIESAIKEFEGKIPQVQKQFYERLTAIIKEIDLDASGNIKVTSFNLEKINSIPQQVELIVQESNYTNAVRQFLSKYSVVSKLQANYFKEVFGNLPDDKALEVIRKQALKTTAQNLTTEYFIPRFKKEISDVLEQKIRSGGSFADLLDEIKSVTQDSSQSVGIISRYGKQIAHDSIYKYSASYIDYVSKDQGLQWYEYVGSLLDNSRPFCIAMKNQKYIHESELDKAADGILRTRTVDRKGMIKSTTGSTLIQNRGGYNCNHRFFPIPERLVPDSVVESVKN